MIPAWGIFLITLLALIAWGVPDSRVPIAAVLCVVVPVVGGVLYLRRLDKYRGLPPGLLLATPSVTATNIGIAASHNPPSTTATSQDATPSPPRATQSHPDVDCVKNKNTSEALSIARWLSQTLTGFTVAYLYGTHVANNTAYLWGVPVAEPDPDTRLRLLILSVIQGMGIGYVFYQCLKFICLVSRRRS